MNGKKIYDEIGKLLIPRANEEFFINIDGKIYKIKELYIPHDDHNIVTFIAGEEVKYD